MTPCKALAEQLGKSPITVEEQARALSSTAFLVPMINEAFFVLAEGLATAEDIDAGMKLGCNHPIGPLALADMVGLDVCLAVMDVLPEGAGRQQVPPLLAAEGIRGRWPPGPQDGPGRLQLRRVIATPCAGCHGSQPADSQTARSSGSGGFYRCTAAFRG